MTTFEVVSATWHYLPPTCPPPSSPLPALRAPLLPDFNALHDAYFAHLLANPAQPHMPVPGDPEYLFELVEECEIWYAVHVTHAVVPPSTAGRWVVRYFVLEQVEGLEDFVGEEDEEY
ncbi:hypothetical protein BDZ91DRAFT_798598 [Kalaharituber pfeilii]|nr:hypothetical protein BDZ91DRAFT_798598 [Kalaharituber pfeilii]